MPLHSSPQIFIDDRCVFSRKRFALVDDLASVDTVIQHEVKRATPKPLAAIGLPSAAMLRFADDASGGEIIPQGSHRPEFEITPKDVAYRFCFRFVDGEF